MSQTPAIFFNPAPRPVLLPAGKATEKQADNSQAPFADLLDESTATGSCTIPKGTEAYGASGTVPGIGAQFAARKAAGGKRTSEVSSPSESHEATGPQPSHWEYASQSAVNTAAALSPGGNSATSPHAASVKQSPAAEAPQAPETAADEKSENRQVLTPGGTLILSTSSFAQDTVPSAALDPSSAATPLVIELAQQSLLPNDSLHAIDEREQTSNPATSIPAGSFTVSGLQTHLAPEALPRFKLSQAMDSTKRESTGGSGTGASTPVSNVSGNAGPVTAVKDASSHRDSASRESPAAVQAAPTAGPDLALAAQAGPQPAASPVQQIFNAIEGAIPAGAPAQNATQADQLAPGGYGPVKSLTIALDPQGLGTVSVELSINNSQLGVRVEASDAGTAQLLKQSGSALTKLLESGGYSVASLSVHVSPQPLPAQAQQAPNGQSAFSMSNSAGGGATGGRDGEANKHQDRKGSGNGRSEGGNRDRSLYV